MVLILKAIGIDYILNILLGRLLRIINTNVDNENYFTNVAYELGKDLINWYNYTIYSEHHSKYNSFSLFKDENSNLIVSSSDVNHCVQLGSLTLGWLLELKLLKSRVEVVLNNNNQSEKMNLLSTGDSLINFIPN